MTAANAPPVDRSRQGSDVKVGDLASGNVLTVLPSQTLRAAATTMVEHRTGSVVVVDDDGALAGILTERDMLRAVADRTDVDTATVSSLMTANVVTATADWEVYEATAEMADRHIRHLVVMDGDRITGVLSIRDLLLAGQRVPLTQGAWAVLRDPLTFSIRERRRLQKYLIDLEAGPASDADVGDLTGLVVASWSFDLPLPADEHALSQIGEDDCIRLRLAVLDELPGLQRAVQPAPGWRRWRT